MVRSLLHALVPPAVVFLLSTSTAARVWLVQPDGSGDAPTIAAAIDSVSGTDIIELADGTYMGEGNRDLYDHEKTFVIRSVSGNPAACVIDCGGTAGEPHRGIVFAGSG